MQSEFLDKQGFNLQAVFDVADLPEAIRSNLQSVAPGALDFRQLILLGNGGSRFWQALQDSPQAGSDPVDQYSVDAVKAFFQETHPHTGYQILYPIDGSIDQWQGRGFIGIQQIGDYAGWQHSSPLKIGINDTWGLWFAYRAVVVADTHLPPDSIERSLSPCAVCAPKTCIAACPVAAFTEHDYSIETCYAHRMSADSPCAYKCLARNSCPVQAGKRYTDEQIAYHYGRSLPLAPNTQ
ncbi:MAG: hypothetical protein HOC23_19330 [Halieaceae bacterium]|jgi:epoxyqueuosine reductase|nr:hypothetical protein [Halieaceae bacterium]